MLISLLLTLVLALPAPVYIQQGTATPDATPSLATIPPETVASAVAEASAPATLPGNSAPEITLETWQEHYGESLDLTLGAWVLTGSTQLPLATVIVFETSEGAQAGIGDFRQESAATSAGQLDAWAIADRGKWACVAADGPVLFLGQAEPEDIDEDQEQVRDRACAVIKSMHDWVVDAVGSEAEATPRA